MDAGTPVVRFAVLRHLPDESLAAYPHAVRFEVDGIAYIRVWHNFHDAGPCQQAATSIRDEVQRTGGFDARG